MEVEFKDLSNEEFYDLISNFYSVYLTKEDILDILFRVNKIEYDKFGKLNSRMTFKDIVSEGNGRDFSWWEETYQIGWMVAISKDLVIDADYNYSKEEIEEMVRNKKIISLGVVVDAIGFEPKLLYEHEKVEKIEMLGINFEYEDSQYLLEDYHHLFDFNSLKEGETVKKLFLCLEKD